MTKLTKQKIFLDIMTANADKSMAEVIPLLMAANDWKEGIAIGAYRWAVREGRAPGVVPVRAKAVKAEKAPKAPAAPKAPKADAKPTKTPEEIAAIKAANLARLKEVNARRKAEKVAAKAEKESAEAPMVEADPFAAPASLTADEVAALV